LSPSGYTVLQTARNAARLVPISHPNQDDSASAPRPRFLAPAILHLAIKPYVRSTRCLLHTLCSALAVATAAVEVVDAIAGRHRWTPSLVGSLPSLLCTPNPPNTIAGLRAFLGYDALGPIQSYSSRICFLLTLAAWRPFSLSYPTPSAASGTAISHQARYAEQSLTLLREPFSC